MTSDPGKAGLLLKEGIVLIRAAYLAQSIDKSIRTIEDELGWAIGKEGHTIRKWKAGDIPLTSGFHAEFLQAAEMLTQKMMVLGSPYLDHTWGERFLSSIGHPAPAAVCAVASMQKRASSPLTPGYPPLRERNDNIQVEIVIKFNLPRDAFYKKLERLLWRFRGWLAGQSVSKLRSHS